MNTRLGDDPQAGKLLLGGPGEQPKAGGLSVSSKGGATILRRRETTSSFGSRTMPGTPPRGGGGGGGGGGTWPGKPRER